MNKLHLSRQGRKKALYMALHTTWNVVIKTTEAQDSDRHGKRLLRPWVLRRNEFLMALYQTA